MFIPLGHMWASKQKYSVNAVQACCSAVHSSSYPPASRQKTSTSKALAARARGLAENVMDGFGKSLSYIILSWLNHVKSLSKTY